MLQPTPRRELLALDAPVLHRGAVTFSCGAASRARKPENRRCESGGFGGQVGYDNPLCQLMKHAQRHNMLLPYGLEDRSAPTSRKAVHPEAQGDEESFTARIDLTPRWKGIYETWHRTIDSPTPDSLTITDEYELAEGDGVEFMWNTFLPVTVGEDVVTIEGECARVAIEIPANCDARVDELPMPEKGPQRRIVFRRSGKAGRLEVKASLIAKAERD